MLTFPNAKINIGLNITSRRDNGYHNIESCFFAIEWSDILEIVPSNKISFKSSGIEIPGDPKSNLCLKAYELIKNDFDISPVKIHLHKGVPIGAGLGGGSADGAFTIKLLNAIFELKLSWETMEDYSLQLGSDCPFFIQNAPAYVEGTGEIMSPIEIDLSEKHIVIVNPGIHISTKEAYQAIRPKSPETNVKLIIENAPINAWQDLLQNDFEIALSSKYPIFSKIKEELLRKGAVYASMTGSGSTFYAFFDELPHNLNFPNNYITHTISPK